MALTLLQRLRVGLRVWLRRRDQSAKRRDEEFLRRNAWAPAEPLAQPAAAAAPGPRVAIDVEGLEVAYLDGSGARVYFLDSERGDVVEYLEDVPDEVRKNPGRFRRVPARSEDSEDGDRRAFVESLGTSPLKQALGAAADAAAFRRALSGHRSAERAWYSFKNERARVAVERWLQDQGLR